MKQQTKEEWKYLKQQFMIYISNGFINRDIIYIGIVILITILTLGLKK